MRELHFNVFGSIVAIFAVTGGWIAFRLGPDGKRRPAKFVVADLVAEQETAQCLADLFHASIQCGLQLTEFRGERKTFSC